MSALAAATRGAGWSPRARLRVPRAVVKLFCMRLTPARRLALAVLAAALAAPGARSDEGAPERVIHYEGDRLTVRLAGAPVTDVLDELGRQAGAEIRGQVRDPREVSVEFEGVPLAEALHRLLGDQNFALVYGNEGRLKSVRLLGGPQTAAAAGAAAPPVSQPPAPGIMDAFAKHAPIAVAGHLGEALGGQQASLLQLFDLSVHHADPTVRAEAARIVIGTIDTDPSLRAGINYYRAAFRSPEARALWPRWLRRFLYGDRPIEGLRERLEDWPRITAPTLLVWGEQDVALGKELSVGMEPLMAGPFEVKYIPLSGHWVQQEQPQVVNGYLLDFLGDLAPAHAPAAS